jgi:hypothetical protein
MWDKISIGALRPPTFELPHGAGHKLTAMSNKPREIRVRNVAPQKIECLQRIASYYGFSVGQFLKFEISKLIESYPEHIKNFKHNQ